MPIKIRKKNHKFEVRSPGGIKSKSTSLAKAKAQQRLLNAIEHDPTFRPRGARRKR
jgi:hypothetical protein